MSDGLRLGDHCDKIGSGATPRGGKEAYLSKGPYSLIRSQNIFNHGFEFSGLAYIDEEQARKLNNVAVREGDVLINITGDSVARACQVHRNVLPARVNQHVAIVRPRSTEIDPVFLRYWMVTPAVQAQLLGLASAGATRPALTKAMLEDMRVPAMGSDQLRVIAHELVEQMRNSATVDWHHKSSAQAKMRVLVKRILKKFGYPPDLEKEAVQSVLAQAEVLLRVVAYKT